MCRALVRIALVVATGGVAYAQDRKARETERRRNTVIYRRAAPDELLQLLDDERKRRSTGSLAVFQPTNR